SWFGPGAGRCRGARRRASQVGESPRPGGPGRGTSLERRPRRRGGVAGFAGTRPGREGRGGGRGRRKLAPPRRRGSAPGAGRRAGPRRFRRRASREAAARPGRLVVSCLAVSRTVPLSNRLWRAGPVWARLRAILFHTAPSRRANPSVPVAPFSGYTIIPA